VSACPASCRLQVAQANEYKESCGLDAETAKKATIIEGEHGLAIRKSCKLFYALLYRQHILDQRNLIDAFPSAADVFSYTPPGGSADVGYDYT
jgi:hypothetical protein